MSPHNGFKKVSTKLATMSVRDAVALHGDSWRFYVGRPYTLGSDLVTFDCIEASSMWLMETGVIPRIRLLDIAGIDL